MVEGVENTTDLLPEDEAVGVRFEPACHFRVSVLARCQREECTREIVIHRRECLERAGPRTDVAIAQNFDVAAVGAAGVAEAKQLVHVSDDESVGIDVHDASVLLKSPELQLQPDAAPEVWQRQPRRDVVGRLCAENEDAAALERTDLDQERTRVMGH